MTDSSSNSGRASKVVLVTGISGAGKSSALKALEDAGFEAIDNVPVSLFDRLVGPGDFQERTAIGIDIRTRDFDAQAIRSKLDAMTARSDGDIELIFIDCDDEVLVRRYEETRRRHPLAQDRPVSDGIRQERLLVSPLRERAGLVIDTSDMALGDLKRTLYGHFRFDQETDLSVFISSFGFKNGVPRDADLVFDVRFLKNPHYVLDLRPLSGCDREVVDYIETDPAYAPFIAKLSDLLGFLLGRYAAEGKSYLTIAIGCTGGRHRSVCTALRLAEELRDVNYSVQVRHRELEIPVR